jgi:rare lipoprotein A (peptidoglycan hydrolase)
LQCPSTGVGLYHAAHACRRGPELPHRGRGSSALRTLTALMHNRRLWLTVAGGLTLLGMLGCAREPTHTLRGVASWYGYPHHGRMTASGRRFDMHELTAAHRTLPLGARVRVTNLRNGRSVVVTITDRGPFVKNRVIDLSYAAARQLGLLGPGTAPVQLEVLS